MYLRRLCIRCRWGTVPSTVDQNCAPKMICESRYQSIYKPNKYFCQKLPKLIFYYFTKRILSYVRKVTYFLYLMFKLFHIQTNCIYLKLIVFVSQLNIYILHLINCTLNTTNICNKLLLSVALRNCCEVFYKYEL